MAHRPSASGAYKWPRTVTTSVSDTFEVALVAGLDKQVFGAISYLIRYSKLI